VEATGKATICNDSRLKELVGIVEDAINRARRNLEDYKLAGEALIEAKKRSWKERGHGDWGAWLKDNFKRVRVCERQARNYMRIARPANWAKIDEARKLNPDLGLDAAVALCRKKRAVANPPQLPPLVTDDNFHVFTGDCLRESRDRVKDNSVQ